MLELDSLKKAIAASEQLLERAHDRELMNSLDRITQMGLKAGVIQHFEFTYELCWKFIKRWLDINLGSVYVDGVSRRELFRLAAEHRLIESVETWMEYHQARNLTSHTYDPVISEEVFKAATAFVHHANQLLQVLVVRND